ncbi:MAG TPA: nucleotidyltransferase family protein [Polyangia bacterium]
MPSAILTPELFATLPPGFSRRRELGPLWWVSFAAADRLASLPLAETRAAAYRATLVRNLAALDRCAEILDAAEAEGLVLLPLKGALFAALVYPDAGARPMADLDLAVRPRELPAAVACLERLGFRRLYGPRARFSPRHGHDVAMTDGHVFVELHYRLMHELGADADVEPLFARAIAVELFGKPRPVPSWDDHLWFTAVHAATHAFGEPAAWPIDLALLLGRGANVSRAAAEARRRGVGAAFDVALDLAHALLPGFVPAPIRRPGLAFRLRLLRLALGADPLARVPARIRSLVARAIVTERPAVALYEIARKSELRLVELLEIRER